MENPQTTLPSSPCGEFRQALQRRQLAQLDWSADRKHLVVMPHTHTNIIVTANENFDKFTVESQLDRWSSAKPLAGQAMDKVREYTGRKQIPDATFNATQLDHVLQEITRMKVNRLAKERAKTRPTAEVPASEPRRLGHYDANSIIGLLRQNELQGQSPWVHGRGASRHLIAEMPDPALNARLTNCGLYAPLRGSTPIQTYAIQPESETRAGAVDKDAFDALFDQIGKYYGDLRAHGKLVNGHLTTEQAASLLTIIKDMPRNREVTAVKTR